MHAFDMSRALITFFEVKASQAIAAEHKKLIFEDMLREVPPAMTIPSKGVRSVLVHYINRELNGSATEAAQAAREADAAIAPWFTEQVRQDVGGKPRVHVVSTKAGKR